MDLDPVVSKVESGSVGRLLFTQSINFIYGHVHKNIFDVRKPQKSGPTTKSEGGGGKCRTTKEKKLKNLNKKVPMTTKLEGPRGRTTGGGTFFVAYCSSCSF